MATGKYHCCLNRQTHNKSDSFCCVFGKFMLKVQRKPITDLVKKAYKLYFDCSLGEQDNNFALISHAEPVLLLQPNVLLPLPHYEGLPVSNSNRPSAARSNHIKTRNGNFAVGFEKYLCFCAYGTAVTPRTTKQSRNCLLGNHMLLERKM
ncbi:hypothetical protein J437_LFUL007311 [Ladona fulva]|uniref:Uncharacterized protein n=1 Tax=Ladona fulva TaxID=123851 RepID=A0A8K0KSN3_LADFU|nr:hypothetical protein J437_LFUL007311 [Ladona fulva]